MAVQRIDNTKVGTAYIDSIVSSGTVGNFWGNMASAISSLSHGGSYTYRGKGDVVGTRTEDILGTLLNFSNISVGGKTYSGTYNTFQDSASQIQSAQNVFYDPTAISLGDVKNAMKANSYTSETNPFFSTFYNYYLGLAQDRQANMTKDLGRTNLLADTTGGSIL